MPSKQTLEERVVDLEIQNVKLYEKVLGLEQKLGLLSNHLYQEAIQRDNPRGLSRPELEALCEMCNDRGERNDNM